MLAGTLGKRKTRDGTLLRIDRQLRKLRHRVRITRGSLGRHGAVNPNSAMTLVASTLTASPCAKLAEASDPRGLALRSRAGGHRRIRWLACGRPSAASSPVPTAPLWIGSRTALPAAWIEVPASTLPPFVEVAEDDAPLYKLIGLAK